MPDYALARKNPAENKLVLECLHSVLQEIGDAALEHDVTGILLGTRDERRVRILSFRRLVPKRVFGRSATLSDSDREAVARLIAGPPPDGELYGLEPVGWFRAQPKRSLSFSNLELELLDTFFTEPAHVAMVLRSAVSGPTRARFYVRESDGFPTNVYRDLIVPVIAHGPMLTVEPEAPRSEFPLLPELPPELVRLGGGSPVAVPPEKTRRIGAWVWRTVSSLAITAFVLGYWWISYSHQQAEREQARRVPEVAADADRQQVAITPGDPLHVEADASTQTPDIQAPPQTPDLTVTPPEPPGSAQTVAEPVQPAPASEDRVVKPQDSRDLRASKTRQQPLVTKPASAPPQRPVPEARALRPLRLPAVPRKVTKIAELSAPPAVARDTVPATPLPLPQSFTMAAPVKTVAPISTPAPTRGTLIWTGRVRKNGTLTIDASSASYGTLTGALPGKPVQIRVYPGDLSDDGILVWTASPQDARLGWDSPGPQNGWNRVLYEYDPHHAEGVEVAEAPGPGNSWKRLVLRCNNSKVSVIYVKWSLVQ